MAHSAELNYTHLRYTFPDDPIVENVINELADRSRVGKEKYGVSMHENHAGLVSWLKQLQHELLDGCVYIERTLQTLLAPDVSKKPINVPTSYSPTIPRQKMDVSARALDTRSPI